MKLSDKSGDHYQVIAEAILHRSLGAGEARKVSGRGRRTCNSESLSSSLIFEPT